jgi:hypothetical protein
MSTTAAAGAAAVVLPEDMRALALRLATIVADELQMCWTMNDWSLDPPAEAVRFRRRVDGAEADCDALAEGDGALTVAAARRLAREIGRMPQLLFEHPDGSPLMNSPTLTDALVIRDMLLRYAKEARR